MERLAINALVLLAASTLGATALVFFAVITYITMAGFGLVAAPV